MTDVAGSGADAIRRELIREGLAAICEEMAVSVIRTSHSETVKSAMDFSTALCDANGQIIETHSVSAGLDYPGVGPEHAWLKDTGRAEYVSITDDEALAAFHACCRIEGIIPALESAHALAYATKLAPTLARDRILLVNLSGRGDKDMATVAERSKQS